MKLSNIEKLILGMLLFTAGFLTYKMVHGQTVPSLQQVQWDLNKAQRDLKAYIASTQPIVPPTQPAYPAWPADITYTPAITEYYSPAGSDTTGMGTQANPYASFARAVQDAHTYHSVNPTALVAIAGRADGTYAAPGNMAENNLLITCYGATNIEQKPTLTASGAGNTAFTWLKVSHVHFQNITLVTPETNQADYGVYINGGDDLTFDYCDLSGFNGFDLCMIGGATNVRVWHTFIGSAYNSNKATMTCSGGYTELNMPDFECDIWYHNGWILPYPMGDQTWLQAMIYRHGEYENPAIYSGVQYAVGGVYKYCFGLRNACTAIQCRAGNANVQWCTFWDNGNAVDVFSGAGLSGKLPGDIGHCAFFGNLNKANPDFPSYGGGCSGQSWNDNLHDLLFAGDPNLSLSPAAAVSLIWNPITTGLPGPTAPSTISNCKGYWPTPAILYGQGRTATVTNYSVMLPPAGKHVPTLLDWRGVTSEADLIKDLRGNLHDPNRSAQAAYAWLDAQLN